MVLDLLTDPDSFFAERAEDPALRWPALLVLVVGLVSVAGSFPVLQATLSALPPEAGGFVTVIQVVGAVVGLVVTFVIWALYAVAFHVIASVAFDADGSLRDTLALVGWGYLPALFGAIAGTVASFVVFSGVRFPNDPAAISRFARELQSRPELVVAGLLGAVFLLWSAFLWTFAVRHAEGLGVREAALTVAGPVLLALALRLNGVFGVV
jgi:hypothetical protein